MVNGSATTYKRLILSICQGSEVTSSCLVENVRLTGVKGISPLLTEIRRNVIALLKPWWLLISQMYLGKASGTPNCLLAPSGALPAEAAAALGAGGTPAFGQLVALGAVSPQICVLHWQWFLVCTAWCKLAWSPFSVFCKMKFENNKNMKWYLVLLQGSEELSKRERQAESVEIEV